MLYILLLIAINWYRKYSVVSVNASVYVFQRLCFMSFRQNVVFDNLIVYMEYIVLVHCM